MFGIADYGWALLKMLLALVVVCALAYVFIRYGLRLLMGSVPRRNAGLIEVLDRRSLTADQNLWVVRVGSRGYLLGSSDKSMTMLGEVDLPSFAEQLAKARPSAAVLDSATHGEPT